MISGKYITAVIGSRQVIGLQKWTCRETVDKLDGQTAQHLGFSANEPGSTLAEVTIEFAQDIAVGEYVAVQKGTIISNLKLYRSQFDNLPAFAFPTFTVFESENMGEIKGKLTLRISGENYGPYATATPGSG